MSEPLLTKEDFFATYYTNNNPLWSRRHHTDGLTHPFIHLLPTDDSITNRPTNGRLDTPTYRVVAHD